MCSQRLCFAVLAMGAVATLPELGRAYPITFNFAGVIESVEDPDDVLEGAAQAGHPFSGSYTFESTTPDSRPNDSGLGLYEPPGPLMLFSIDALQLAVAPNNSRIGVRDDERWGDSYGPVALFPFLVGDLTILEIGLTFEDEGGLVFTNDDLPLRAPDLDAFETRQLRVQGGKSGSPDFFIYGEVAMLIPEPGSLLLLLAGFALMTRRRGCQSQ